MIDGDLMDAKIIFSTIIAVLFTLQSASLIEGSQSGGVLENEPLDVIEVNVNPDSPELTDLSLFPLIAYASLTRTPIILSSTGEVLGDPVESSIKYAELFPPSDSMVIGELNDYEQLLCSVPLASSLKCPLLLVDGEVTPEQNSLIEDREVEKIYEIGSFDIDLEGITEIRLPTYMEIAQAILEIHPVDYIAVTNPDDWTSPGRFIECTKASLSAAEVASFRDGIIIPIHPSFLGGWLDWSFELPALFKEKVESYSKIELKVKKDLDELSITPRFIAIVGGPGAIPFKETWTPDPYTQLLDPILALNDDLTNDCEHFSNGGAAYLFDDDPFVDVAVGRIAGSTVFDCFRLEYYAIALENKASMEAKLFAHSLPSDPVLQDAEAWSKYFAQELRWNGFETGEYYQNECTVNKLNEEIDGFNGLLLIGVHGSSSGMQLAGGEMLSPATLDKSMDGAIVLLDSCSVANGIASTPLGGGLNERLGGSLVHAFIDHGAGCYVASTELADSVGTGLIITNTLFNLVRDGVPVGIALQNSKNLLLSYRTTLQEAIANCPDVGFDPLSLIPFYSSVTWRTSGIVVMIGDPAFKPYSGYGSPLSASLDGSNLTVEIPSDVIDVEVPTPSMRSFSCPTGAVPGELTRHTFLLENILPIASPMDPVFLVRFKLPENASSIEADDLDIKIDQTVDGAYGFCLIPVEGEMTGETLVYPLRLG